jgi:hypothetical protein
MMKDTEQIEDEEAYFTSAAADYDHLQPIIAGPAYDQGLDTIVRFDRRVSVCRTGVRYCRAIGSPISRTQNNPIKA